MYLLLTPKTLLFLGQEVVHLVAKTSPRLQNQGSVIMPVKIAVLWETGSSATPPTAVLSIFLVRVIEFRLNFLIFMMMLQ